MMTLQIAILAACCFVVGLVIGGIVGAYIVGARVQDEEVRRIQQQRRGGPHV